MQQIDKELCCMKSTLESQTNACQSLQEVTAAIDDRLTAVEQPLPSTLGPVAAERLDVTVQETTAPTSPVASRSPCQAHSPAWTTVVKKAGRSKPAAGNSAVQHRPCLGKTSARLERNKAGIIGTGTAGNIKTITTKMRRCMILICGRLVLLFAGILSHAGLKSLVGGRFDWKLIHATSYLRHSLCGGGCGQLDRATGHFWWERPPQATPNPDHRAARDDAARDDAARDYAARDDAARDEAAGDEAAGDEAAGVEAAGVEAAGVEAAGVEAAGVEAAGVEAAGVEAAGVEAAGDEAAGDEAAGVEAAGDEAAGDEAAKRATPAAEAAMLRAGPPHLRKATRGFSKGWRSVATRPRPIKDIEST
ncbi:unnamed protein product [Boreogadus saida]